MIEFFRKLFSTESSGATARERLRLVLLSDHLSLAPDVVESLRADLIAVISKYVEVDEKNCDVSFEQQDRAVAVMANIPIISLRSRPGPPAGPPPANRAAPPEQPSVAGSATLSARLEQKPVAVAGAAAAHSTRRRKRRRRSGTHPSAAAG